MAIILARRWGGDTEESYSEVETLDIRAFGSRRQGFKSSCGTSPNEGHERYEGNWSNIDEKVDIERDKTYRFSQFQAQFHISVLVFSFHGRSSTDTRFLAAVEELYCEPDCSRFASSFAQAPSNEAQNSGGHWRKRWSLRRCQDKENGQREEMYLDDCRSSRCPTAPFSTSSYILKDAHKAEGHGSAIAPVDCVAGIDVVDALWFGWGET
ncbi:hypothetical protein C8J56DRAFT_891657 [Mycena floridula]|nr:hypothetical protein C8J56DRAFT_891657 [Mycena floridula]